MVFPELKEYDHWVDWAKDTRRISRADVPRREDKEARIRYKTSVPERVMAKLGFVPESLERKKEEVLNDLDAYDNNPETEEIFERDFYERALENMRREVGLRRFEIKEEVDLTSLNNFAIEDHFSVSETLEKEDNSYLEGGGLGVKGEAEGLNILRGGRGRICMNLDDIGPGILDAKGGKMSVDLPDLEGYTDVYLRARDGLRVRAGEIGPGAHLYAETAHGEAKISVDGVDDNGMLYVIPDDTTLEGADLEEDTYSIL